MNTIPIKTAPPHARLFAVLLIALVTACSPGKESSATGVNEHSEEARAGNGDCLEPVNRGIFRVNEIIDGVLIKPLTHIYRGVVPEFGQKGIKNALTNLSAPVIFINSVLQADITNAGKTVSRFAINSTVGLMGFFDVATEFGIKKENRKDFGQTLGVYGVGTGSYLVIPLIGPSDIRDTVGMVADIFMDPFTYIFTTNESLARAGMEGIVKRSDYMRVTDRVYHDSLDPYATFRSIFLQNRYKTVQDYLGNDGKSDK